MLNSKPPGPGGSAATATANNNSNHITKTSHTDDHVTTRKESQSAEPGSYRRHSEIFESNPIYFNPYHTIMPIPAATSTSTASTQRPTNFLPFQQFQSPIGQQINPTTTTFGGIPSVQTPTSQQPLTPSQINNNNNNNDYYSKFNHLSFYQKLQQGPPTNATNSNRNIYVNPATLFPHPPAVTHSHSLTPQPQLTPGIIQPLTSNHFFPHSNSTASFFSLTNKPAPNPLELIRRQQQQQQQQQINREQDILDDEFLSLFKPSNSTTTTTTNKEPVKKPIAPEPVAPKPAISSTPAIVKSDSTLNSSNLIDLDSMTDTEQLSKLSTFELFDPLLAAEREEARKRSIEALQKAKV
jgi:hypothetical protein